MAAKAGDAFVDFHGDFTSLRRRVAAEVAPLTKNFGTLGKAAAVGLAGGVAVTAIALKRAVGSAADFEQQMSATGAVTDANSRALERLRKQALAAGAATKFSATEAAVAQTELAKGGLSAANILRGGLRSALALAAAGNLELGEASSITANAMKLFGLQGNKTRLIADALATAANTTTADVRDFGMALSQGGGAARAAGLSFAQTIVILEALAQAGVKNSDAGTSMRAALIQLSRPTRRQAEAAKELGLEFFNARGRMKDLADISEMLRRRLGGLTHQQRVEALATIAGTDGFRTLLALYEQGPRRIERLTREVTRQGTAARVAARLQDNLRGKLEQLGGAVETIQIIIGSALIPALTTAAAGAARFIGEMATGRGVGGDFADTVRELAAQVLAAVGSMRPMAQALLPIVVGVGGLTLRLAQLGLRIAGSRTGMILMSAAAGALIGRLLALGTAFGVSKILSFVAALRQMGVALTVQRINFIAATGATNASTAAVLRFAVAQRVATGASRGLAAAMMSTGFGALIVLVGTVAGAFLGLSRSTDRSTTSARQLNEALRSQANALRAVRDIDLDVAQRKADLRSANVAVEASENRLRRMRQQGRQGTLAYKQAEADLAQARVQQRRAERDLRDTRADATQKQQDANKATREAVRIGSRRIETLKEEVDSQKDRIERTRIDLQLWRGTTGAERRVALTRRTLSAQTAELSRRQAALRREMARQGVIRTMRDEISRLTRRLRGLDEGSSTYRRTATRLRNTQDTLNDVLNRVPGATRRAQRGFGTLTGTVGGLGGAMGDVSSYTSSTTNRLLEAFGAKPIRLSVKPFRLTPGQRFMRALGMPVLGGFQRGGMPESMVVPGTGTGDKVHLNAMVEPGERVFVLNRNASKALRQLKYLNATVPRFQKGGEIPQGGFPDAMGALPGLDALGWFLSRRFGLSVVSGLRPGAITTTGNPSDHGWGGAIDISNGITTPQMDAAYAFLTRTAIARAIKQILYRTMIGGNHFNHIHVALQPFFANNAGAVMSLLGGGAFGLLPKMEIFGPNGPLLDATRGVASRLREAANDYLTKHMSFGTRFAPGDGDAFAGGAFGKQRLMALWQEAGGNPSAANMAAAIALAESSGNASAIGIPTSAGRAHGLWQIMWPLHSGRFPGMDPLNPFDNARMAVALSGNGTNWNPWEVYTNGAYSQFLQKGGLVRRILRAIGPLGRARRRIRSRILAGLIRRIRGIGIPRRLAHNLARFEQLQEAYGQRADYASQMGITDANGNDIPGVFGGKDEKGWLNDQLRQLFKWRNAMIRARGLVRRALERVAQAIEATRRRLHEIIQRIIEQGRVRADLEKALNEEDPRGARRRLEERLRRLRRHPRSNRGEIESTERQLRALDLDRRERRRKLRERIEEIDRQQGIRVRQRNNLKDRVLPALSRRREGMQGDLESYASNLVTVQGAGANDSLLPTLPGLDSPDVLGGTIFSVMVRLRDLMAPRPVISDSDGTGESPPVSEGDGADDSERAAILEQLLRESRQREFAANQQFDVLRNIPFAGIFHKGGVVPGPVGKEMLALVEGGERITRAGGDVPYLVVNGDIVSSHKDPVEAVVGDHRFKAAVRQVGRDDARMSRYSGRAGRN